MSKRKISNVRGLFGDKLRRDFPDLVFRFVPNGVYVFATCCWEVSSGGGRTRPTQTLQPDMGHAVRWAIDHTCEYKTARAAQQAASCIAAARRESNSEGT